MPSNYDNIDIQWTYNGDFAPGVDGDFLDTQGDQIQSVIQQIQTVVQSEVNDWQEHPSLGANLTDFVGEPNTRDTGKEIQERVGSALITAGITRAADTAVRVVPVGIHEVLIVIRLDAIDTVNNSLDDRESPVVTLVFDTTERTVIPIDKIRPDKFFDPGR